jgi:DNA-binding SARP family transcriptional activator
MMLGRENDGPTPTYPTSYQSLPFALSGVSVAGEPPASALMARLDLLQQLAVDTRGQVELLRRQSAQILDALTPPAAPVIAVERAPLQPAPATLSRAADEPSSAGASSEERGLLRIYLFGTFEVRTKGGTLTRWASRKSRLLLAYLAMEPERLVPKDVLIDLFWPDSSPRRGSNNLSIAIYQFRASLRGLVRTDSQGVCVRQGLYGLDPTLAYCVDANEFQRHLAQARAASQRRDKDLAREHLTAAVDLYRGEFLESDPYEEWTVEPRRAYAASYARALAWLAADAADSRDWPGLLDYGTRMIGRDPCAEEGHRWLMTAHWQLGNRAQALLQYRICSERLMEELEVEPSEETRRLFLTIKGGD